MILREVVTRFRFEAAEKDLSNIQKNIDSLKGGLGKVAGLFGIGLGVGGAVALGKFGMSAERVHFQLKRIAGEKYDKFEDIFVGVNRELETTRKGLSDLFKPKMFEAAAAGFARVFGTGEEQMESFRKILRFAVKESAMSGVPVEEIAANIQEAIQSGGFEPLMGMPGFDLAQKQLREFQQQAMTIGGPGGPQDVQNRMQQMVQLIDTMGTEQDRSLRNVKDSVLAGDKLANKMQETLDTLGKTLLNSLAPALEKLTKVIDFVIKKFGIVNEEAEKTGTNPALYAYGEAFSSIGTGISDAAETVTNPKKRQKAMDSIEETLTNLGWLPPFKVGPHAYAERNVNELKRLDEMYKGNIPEEVSERFKSRPGYDEFLQQRGGAQGGGVSMTNTFNITGNDPDAIAREVKRKQGELLEDARASYPPTERR